MPDRIQRLRQAAQTRHETTLARAERAIRELSRRGGPISYRVLAETAGVSRSWLYRQPAIREQIDRLRGGPGTPRTGLPAAERATADSLHQQIHTYRAEINRLRTENRELREQLARRLGTERAAATTAPAPLTSATCPQQ